MMFNRLHWWHISAILFVVSIVFANPIPDESIAQRDHAPIQKRALPHFVNFRSGSTRKRDLVEAIKDMVHMANTILKAYTSNDVDPDACARASHVVRVLDDYFPSSSHDQALLTLQRLVSPATIDPSTGADRLAGIVIDGNDFNGLCNSRFGGAEQSLFAYTDSGWDERSGRWVRGHSRIHFCDEAFDEYRLLGYYRNPGSHPPERALDDYVSYKMLSLGTLVLHEFMHTQEMSKNFKAPHIPSVETITDVFVRERDGGRYFMTGPKDVRSLRDRDGDDRYTTLTNAANYEWFVAETYYSIKGDFEYRRPRNNFRAKGHD